MDFKNLETEFKIVIQKGVALIIRIQVVKNLSGIDFIRYFHISAPSG